MWVTGSDVSALFDLTNENTWCCLFATLAFFLPIVKAYFTSFLEPSSPCEANLKSKRPLTPEHRQLRLQWCQARSMWNVTYWQKVVFSDESRFVLGTDDNRVRSWRCPGAIFQQDNARPHTARVAQDFLRHFQTLPWLARSPDLFPVEHVWDQLKRQMPSCHSVHELDLAVQDLWTHLPQDKIRCLINSMPDRVAACIAAGGGPTRY
ncbi:transposable element Tcb2 transposase [Trichonephila clavipes]|nr:transposable element Tcb2 transposase [Trichonephila clavipes]